MADKTDGGTHYSDGRRWSRISKAWIFDKDWNDQEEIAMLREENAELREQLFAARLDATPQNPCSCVADGDDGKVAHLCKWHNDAFGKAYRMQNVADSLTVENIAKLPMDKLRLWIAHGIQESSARKRAEEQLAAAQGRVVECDGAAIDAIERYGHEVRLSKQGGAWSASIGGKVSPTTVFMLTGANTRLRPVLGVLLDFIKERERRALAEPQQPTQEEK